MDIVSPVVNILSHLLDCTADHGSCGHFKENVESLRKAIGELESFKENVIKRVERDKRQDCSLQRTIRVKEWLETAEFFTGDSVKSMLGRGDAEIQKKCFGNCLSRFKLGKEIFWMTQNVRNFICQAVHFDIVTEPLPRHPVDEIPMDKTVGFDSTFIQLWSCFQDKNDKSTEIIGLYGMGGVGKTTLLKKLNNKFLHENRTDFQVVIWVVVSTEVNLWKIQEEIAKKLGMGDGMWKSKTEEHERAVEIFKILRQKKFVLLLDDLWEPINLAAVGVPLENTMDLELYSRLVKRKCAVI